ncbi:MAG: hemolysin family protein [Candidatus Sumerlaeaceae bacterium]
MILTLIGILILLNGVFSMAETAVVSARKTRLQKDAEDGNTRARSALRLAMKPNRFLATVQIGITAIGILSGALGEATIAQDLQVWLHAFPVIANYAAGLSLAMVGIALTLVSILFGELLPKRIALMYPEAIAKTVATPMRWLSRGAAPIVGLLDFLTSAIIRLLGIRANSAPPVTQEELKVLIKQGADAGVFEKTETDIVTNVLRLADRRASMLMTPRTDITWIDLNETEDEVRTKMIGNPHAFFPVAQGNLDHIVGILAAKDCLARVLAGDPIDVDDMMHKPLIVPESVSSLQLLESFRESPAQIALIADEYGSILGLVTQNDMLQSIVGDLPSSEGDAEPEAVRREDGSWLISGSMPADEFRELFRLGELPQDSHYDTVGGFVLLQLQRIPSVADHFIYKGLRFEIVDMDGKRIDKVLVSESVGTEATK